MTVAQEVVFVRGVGNGVTRAFSVPFSAENVDDIQASVDGVSVVVSGYDANAKTVSLVSAPASGAAIEIWRSTPLAQTLDANNQNALPPENLERLLDRLVRIQQEGQEAFTRSVKAGRGEVAPDLPTPEAGKAIGWGADGDLVNADVPLAELGQARDEAVSNAAAAVAARDTAVSARDQAQGYRLNASNAAAMAEQSEVAAAESASHILGVQDHVDQRVVEIAGLTATLDRRVDAVATYNMLALMTYNNIPNLLNTLGRIEEQTQRVPLYHSIGNISATLGTVHNSTQHLLSAQTLLSEQ